MPRYGQCVYQYMDFKKDCTLHSTIQFSSDGQYNITSPVTCGLISCFPTMEKTLAIANVVFGILTFCFHDPESATVSICGGIYLVVFGLLLISSKLKNKVIIIGLGVKAAFVGIALISIYTKSVDGYQGLLDDCQLIATVIYGLKQCDRIAWDPIMAILGSLIIVVNLFLAVIAYISKSNSSSKTIV